MKLDPPVANKLLRVAQPESEAYPCKEESWAMAANL